MANFSTAELELINNQRKSDADLPNYFAITLVSGGTGNNITAGTDVPISRDFEAYLILQTQDQKQKTLSWISRALDIQQEKIDRDDILFRYYDLRTADANNRISQLDEALDNFDQFKVGLLTDSSGSDPARWANVVEVGLMAQSLQRPIDEIYILRERAFHEKTITSLMRTRALGSPNTPDTRRELQSWQTVVSAYPGQASSGASLATSTPARGV